MKVSKKYLLVAFAISVLSQNAFAGKYDDVDCKSLDDKVERSACNTEKQLAERREKLRKRRTGMSKSSSCRAVNLGGKNSTTAVGTSAPSGGTDAAGAAH